MSPLDLKCASDALRRAREQQFQYHLRLRSGKPNAKPVIFGVRIGIQWRLVERRILKDSEL